jgi:hypothetical protein
MSRVIKQHQLEKILSLSRDIKQHNFIVVCQYPLSRISSPREKIARAYKQEWAKNLPEKNLPNPLKVP